jgi:hypothetical protein
LLRWLVVTDVDLRFVILAVGLRLRRYRGRELATMVMHERDQSPLIRCTPTGGTLHGTETSEKNRRSNGPNRSLSRMTPVSMTVKPIRFSHKISEASGSN